MIKCTNLAIQVSDNLFVKLAKVLPNGLNEINKFLGLDGCSNSADIFHSIISQLEPVIYFIISLF
jgi:hypothetical protein